MNKRQRIKNEKSLETFARLKYFDIHFDDIPIGYLGDYFRKHKKDYKKFKRWLKYQEWNKDRLCKAVKNYVRHDKYNPCYSMLFIAHVESTIFKTFFTEIKCEDRYNTYLKDLPNRYDIDKETQEYCHNIYMNN